MSFFEPLPDPTSAADTAECPSCASALFPLPAPGPIGWVWSHDGTDFESCPNDTKDIC